MDSLVSLISNVGFPSAVCIFLLWKIGPAMSKLTEVVLQLESTMKAVKDELKEIRSIVIKCER